MISLDEARSRILSAVSPLDAVALHLDACAGLILAEEVIAEHPIPPFDNSAMDGFAVRHSDLSSLPVLLPVVAVSAAGRPADRPIEAGEAARILTGAVMVSGADTVVPVEATRPASPPGDGGGEWVEIVEASQQGAHVRRAGEDIAKGAVALSPGRTLGPSDLGLAASCGVGSLSVIPRPRVAVVSTGTELVQPGSGGLAPGQIYDSNRVTIASALGTRCGIPGVTTSHVGDDPGECRSELLHLAEDHDVILSTGGVSMGGEYDVVKVALGEASASVDFWQVSIKPSKPLAFGRVGDAWYVGLPGNPVSALVSLELFVRPMLSVLGGKGSRVSGWGKGELGERLHKRQDGKIHFVRARRDVDGRLRPSGGQGSHQLHAMAAADALLVVPDGREDYEPGTVLDIIEL